MGGERGGRRERARGEGRGGGRNQREVKYRGETGISASNINPF